MIDLATAKKHLRIDANDEDAIVQVYLSAAIATVENATSKPLTAREAAQLAKGFPCGDRAIGLYKGPVDGATAAISIKYDDTNGVEQTLGDFRLIEGSNAKLQSAYGASWPAAKTAEGSVRISYIAGYASGEVPPALDQAVLLLTAHFYSNREAVAVSAGGGTAVELPLAVEMLIAQYRAPGIA